jgi:hypothetical protein
MTSAVRSMGSPQKDELADYVSRPGSSDALKESRPYDGPQK